MAIQNSIYAPTPFSTANGGTGNSATLATNQTWIGNGTATPTPTTLTAGTDITLVSGPGTLTINATAANASATVLTNPTASVTFAPNTTYMPTNTSGGITTFTLPASPTIGNFYGIVGAGTQGWKIAQNAGQQISVGGVTTTAGTGGSITSNNAADGIYVYCQTSTLFIGEPSQGQVTIT